MSKNHVPYVEAHKKYQTRIQFKYKHKNRFGTNTSINTSESLIGKYLIGGSFIMLLFH